MAGLYRDRRSSSLPITTSAQTLDSRKMERKYRTPSLLLEARLKMSATTPLDRTSFDTASGFERSLRPRTPSLKSTIVDTWGLPSPQTPSFGQHAFNKVDIKVRKDSITTSEGNVRALEVEERTASSMVQAHAKEESEKQNEEFERQIDPAEMRRSSRISAKAKVQETPQPHPVARKALPAPEPEPLPESIATLTEADVPCIDIDPVPFEGLPAPHSIEWQLQYPSKGSTHPIYPFPTPDPRLIFHEKLVPTNNDLPDCTRVPPLILPMGWRHVSWFGLLPIVFDPYRQAFKLTSAGPLPLCHEELHQNGLAKYVPGGEMHPETVLLPDMRLFSDGSEGEVYEWPEEAWTLPWAAQANTSPFDGALQLRDMANVGHTTGNKLLEPVAVIWREERDCPNQVYTVWDGWRWLACKEKHPSADFIPNPAKQWHGAGAYRSYRKTKSPIAELMMLSKLAVQNSDSDSDAEEGAGAEAKAHEIPDSEMYLQNQDARSPRKNCFFCPFKSVATPVYVDITLLGDTEITLMELLCYFPQHYGWGAAAERLRRAGVNPSLIRDFINMTRVLVGDVGGLERSKIKSAVQTAKKRDAKEKEEKNEVAREAGQGDRAKAVSTTTTRYTTEGWQYELYAKIDYPVVALAHGLKELPSGSDVGPMTALILHCRANACYEVLLSDVPRMLKEVGIEPLIEPGENGCPDLEVMTRHKAALKKDRARVKQSAEEGEWDADEGKGMGKNAKKRKLREDK